ncbi:MAG: hypothetical protein WBV22_06665, partial [Anaerolineaceae bacterium]
IIDSMRHCLIYLGFYVLLISTACGQTGIPISVTDTISTRSTLVNTTPVAILSPTTFEPTPAPTELSEFIYAPDEGQPVYPLASLRILSPGCGSRLTSPIQTDLSVILGVDNTIQIELSNSSGELLVKKVIRYQNVSPDQRILIYPALDFEIDDEEENGRLAIKIYDSFNRLISMSSCELTLLSDGMSEIAAAGVPYEPFLITEPASGSVIQGGVVTVYGYARPVSQSSIVIELVDENGVELANRQLIVRRESNGSPVIFSTTLPYQVFKTTFVRLIIRQSIGPLPGPAVATSLLITIK